MAKRIATQLAEEIGNVILDADEHGEDRIHVPIDIARRWLKWAKMLDARMRLDGSKASKQKKPAKK